MRPHADGMTRDNPERCERGDARQITLKAALENKAAFNLDLLICSLTSWHKKTPLWQTVYPAARGFLFPFYRSC